MRKYILNSAKGKKFLTEMLEKKNINNVTDSILESAINKLDDNSVNKLMDKLVNEGYDDVGVEYVKNNRPKLSTYDNDKLVSDRKELDGYTLLHFGLDDTNPYDTNEVKAFDNQDGTEIANSHYMYEDGELKCAIDVRGDKRRKGIASNIYKWIEELTGDTIQPDNPSELAQKFWNQPNRPFGSNKK